jgi:hypothetical protein
MFLDRLKIAHVRSSNIAVNGVRIWVDHCVNDLTIDDNNTEYCKPCIDLPPWQTAVKTMSGRVDGKSPKNTNN